MISSPFRWLVTRRAKARARALAASTLSRIEIEGKSWKKLANGPACAYLGAELGLWIKRLRREYKTVRDADRETYEAVDVDLDWLQEVLNRSLDKVCQSERVRTDHEKLLQRITDVDAGIRQAQEPPRFLPVGAVKEYRDSVAHMASLRFELLRETRQRESHVKIRALEHDLQQHVKWLYAMERTHVELENGRTQLELLLSSTAWNSTKGAADCTDQARTHLSLATRAWNVGQWPRASISIAEAANYIKTARKFCDRTWQQANDELQMWKKFLGTRERYPAMKQTLDSLPPELPPAGLQKWIDHRQETEREINTAASETCELLRSVPLRSPAFLPWGESDPAAHLRFAKAVQESCKEAVNLLSRRHSKRRRRYKSPAPPRHPSPLSFQ